MSDNEYIRSSKPLEAVKYVASFASTSLGQEAQRNLHFLKGIQEGVERIERVESIVEGVLKENKVRLNILLDATIITHSFPSNIY